MLASGKRWVAALAVTGVIILSGFALATLTGVGAARSVAGSTTTPYAVTFTETGLPARTDWSVHVAFSGCGCYGVRTTGSSASPTITIPVTNGTYTYRVLRVPGYYVIGAAHGTFNVTNSSPSPIAVAFAPVIPFTVEFTEVGLPAGTPWTVSVSGNGHGQERTTEDQTETAYGTSMGFSLPNATYHYLVAAVPGSFFVDHSNEGTFNVSGTSPPPVLVQFATPPTFVVTFSERGLPSGTNWSVRLAGWGGVPIHETGSSTATAVTFALPNGTYRYTIGEVLGFVTNGSTVGDVRVTNASTTVTVSFQPVPSGALFPVAFVENGLANGTSWSVTVTATETFGPSRSASQSSAAATVFFLLPNGTYRYQVHPVRGYSSVTARGAFAIAGAAPDAIVVNFTAVPTYAVSFTESGLANGTAWAVLIRSQSAGSTPWPIRLVERSNTTTMIADLPNGTYCYRVYAVPGYTVTSGAAVGPISVTGGSPAGVAITFSPKG